jgi:hypothetical protein
VVASKVLTSNGMETKTLLGNPIAVSNPDSLLEHSYLALTLLMASAGWSRARRLKGEEAASIQNLRYYEGNSCNHYFVILLEQPEKALMYEVAGQFFHSMLHGYYRALLAAMLHCDGVQNVPTTLKGKTYDQLRKFFEGVCDLVKNVLTIFNMVF